MVAVLVVILKKAYEASLESHVEYIWTEYQINDILRDKNPFFLRIVAPGFPHNRFRTQL